MYPSLQTDLNTIGELFNSQLKIKSTQNWFLSSHNFGLNINIAAESLSQIEPAQSDKTTFEMERDITTNILVVSFEL